METKTENADVKDPILKAIEDIRSAAHAALTGEGGDEPCKDCGEVHDDGPIDSLGSLLFTIDSDGELLSGSDVDEVPVNEVHANMPAILMIDGVFAVIHVFEATARGVDLSGLPKAEREEKLAQMKELMEEAGRTPEVMEEMFEASGLAVKVSEALNVVIATRGGQYHVCFEKLADGAGLGDELFNTYKSKPLDMQTSSPLFSDDGGAPAGVTLH